MAVMASSSVGSDVFAILSLLLISGLVILLLRYYLPLRTTPGYLLFPVFLALVLPFSIILLVPIDLASQDTSRSHAIWLPEKLTLVCWKVSYWLTFVLTWLLLPLLGEYVDSGFREPKDRFTYSLRTNARYQLIVLGVGTVGLVYFILENGFHGSSIKSLVMALAYAWGLFLAIYLMGHGLVAIPRRLFHSSSLGRTLQDHQAQAPRIHSKMQDAIDDLQSLETQLLQLQRRKNGLNPDMRDWIDALTEAAPTIAAQSSAPSTQPPAIVTPRYLAELSRKIKRARHKHARFVGEWHNLVAYVKYLEQVINASASKQLVLDSRPDAKTLFTMPLLTPRARFYYHAHVLPASRFVLGTCLAILSITLVWSEVVHTFTSKISIVNLTVVSHPTSSTPSVSFRGQLIASIWLCYMCTAALYSLSKVKVWGNRALVKRQTYAESAAWYSLQVAKLTVPLSYNFITMLDPAVYKATSFFAFLGKLINLTPLGKEFSTFFPIFVLVPVCATLFNLYGRIRRIIGFVILEDDEDNDGFSLAADGGSSRFSTPYGGGTASWQEGALLIQREANSAVRPPQPLRNGVAPYTDAPQYSAAAGRSAPRQGTAIAAPDGSAPEDDSARYFFQDLGERIRNTIDTTDRPNWLQGLGASFKRPAWMAADGSGPPAGGREDESSTATGPGGTTGRGSSLGRIFGGSRSDDNGRTGGIRL